MNKEQKQSIRFHTMAVFLIIILCFSLTPKTFQNDTFYTIKIGEYIEENGITMKDPFSWHDNLDYTYPHWAYDVLIYNIYKIGGFTGIYVSTVIFAALLGLLVYYINIKLVKDKFISFVITILTIYLMEPFICARAQLVTFSLFMLTVFFIEKFLESGKKRYAIGLIVIPILIANLHAATFLFYFILYIPYLAEYAVYIFHYSTLIICNAVITCLKIKIKKKGENEKLNSKLEKEESRYTRLEKKLNKKIEEPYKIQVRYNSNIKWLFVIFLLCFCTGMITPIGNTPYTYLTKTIMGISTKNINEHLPLSLVGHVDFSLLIVFYLAVIALTRIKIRAADLFMFLGLTFLAICSTRQITMVYLIGSMILGRLCVNYLTVTYNEEDIKKYNRVTTSMVMICILIIGVLSVSILAYKKKMNDKYINESDYPVKACDWMLENIDDVENIRIYNSYNYGSYIIFRGIPVFIDSRCDLYLPEFNKDAHMFYDFLNLDGVNFTNMKGKINEYDFDYFLIYSNQKLDIYFRDRPDEYIKVYPEEGDQDIFFTIYKRVKKIEEIEENIEQEENIEESE